MNIAYVDPAYSRHFQALSGALARRTGGEVVALLSSPAYRLYTGADRAIVWQPGTSEHLRELPPEFEHATWAPMKDPRSMAVFAHAVEWFKQRFVEQRIELCLVFSDARPFSVAARLAAQELGVVILYFERGAFRLMSSSLSTLGLNSRFSLKRAETLPGITGVAQEMFATVAPEMSGFGRVALSNLWLFGPLVQKQLEGGAATNAMLRTTTSPTITRAGNKDNVLPGVAEATVNFRILPGETRESVTAHVRSQVESVVAKEKYELYAMDEASDPSKVSPTTSPQYKLVNTTIREVFPEALVAPGLMIGATDSRHFGELSDHIFKFSPIVAKPVDLPRFHGTNERIAVSNYADAIRFYHRLMSQASKASQASAN